MAPKPPFTLEDGNSQESQQSDEKSHETSSVHAPADSGEPTRSAGGLDDFPDGGLRAWSVVAGAWAANMCSFGWINCKACCLPTLRASADVVAVQRHRGFPGLLPE